MNKQQFFKKYKTHSLKKTKCSSCEEMVKTYLGAYRQENYGYYEMFNMCEGCFCNSTAEQRLKVFDVVGISSEFLQTKCSLCKLRTNTFLQLERNWWFPRAICPECFSFILQDKNERYFLIIDKNQSLKIKELEKILVKFSQELGRTKEYHNGDFKRELKENGLYPFVANQTKYELEEVQKILGEKKVKTTIIDNQELHKIMHDFVNGHKQNNKAKGAQVNE